MDRSMIIGYHGLRAIQERVDTIANNVANLNTTAFKTKESSFGEILYQQMPSQQPGGEQANANGRITPEQIRSAVGVRTALTATRFTQGASIATSIETDLMIEGEGFFRVTKDVNGNGIGDDPIYYTRAGRFTRSPVLQGDRDYLVTPTGEFLLDEFDNPVYVEGGNAFRVDPDGTVTEILPDGTENRHYEQIAVYRLPNPDAIANLGNNLYAYPGYPPVNNNPHPLAPVMMNYASDRYAIRQGSLEASTVDLIKEMTAMMEAERHMQLTARALQTSDQFLQLANEMVRR